MVPNRSPISAAHVRTLIDAAADAGFSGVEFWMNHHDWAVADGMSSEEFFDYYRDRGLSLIAAELTDKWATPDRQAVTEGTAHLLELAARAGASSVLAVARELPSFDDAATGLGHFCDLAGERGLGVSLELVPFGGVTNIATFARMLEMVDRDNLGLCLDAWHWHRQRGGPDIPTLRTIPADRIHLLQLDDAAAQPADDLLVETMTARLLPGEARPTSRACSTSWTRWEPHPPSFRRSSPVRLPRLSRPRMPVGSTPPSRRCSRSATSPAMADAGAAAVGLKLRS